MLTLVLGGARSGKSEIAERLAAASGGPVAYVATMRADDASLAERIAAHRARRPAAWRTVESGEDLPGALDGLAGTVLIDSLGPWVAARLEPAADTDSAGPDAAVSTDAGPDADAANAVGRDAGVGPDAAGAANRTKDDAAALCAALARRIYDTIVVSEEVGLGVIPSTAIGGAFRDALGTVNRAVAEVADRVLLVVAGKVLTLTDPPER